MRKKYWVSVCALGGIIILGILAYAGAKIIPTLMAQRKFNDLKTNLLSDDNGGALTNACLFRILYRRYF